MHSRIYALKLIESPTQATNDFEVFDEDTLDFDSYSSFADYVRTCEKEYWKEDIEWLTDFAKFEYLEVNDQYVLKIDLNALETFLKKRYDNLLNLVKTMTFESFSEKFDLYQIEMACEDKYGFHIVEVGGGYPSVDTLDEFLHYIYRYMKRENKQTLYYQLQSVLDYHS